MNHWSDKLVALNACDEAVIWARTQTSYATAWKVCERGDWMLWLAGRLSGSVGSKSRRKLVGAAAECAELALPIFERRYPNDKRVRECIEVCKRYSIGQANLDELRKARRSADASDAAAVYAAAAGVYAADAGAAAVYAAAITAITADAADAAAYAADAAARLKTFKQCADIARKHYPKAPHMNGEG